MKLLKKVGKSPLAVSILISLLVCICVIGIRSIRSLEFLELAAYDYYLRFKSPAVTSYKPPVVLITVSEEDIQQYGRWPLTDLTLASLLKTLGSYHPRAIGLDIFRDIPVPPGSKQLTDVFSEFQNIVTIKKIGDDKSTTVPPPYMVKNLDMVGFNDIVVDSEGLIRRGLLFMDDGETQSYSFSLILAMLYLQAEGIAPGDDETEQHNFKLGKTVFIPLEQNDGGYINTDARGYQFLLDFSDIKIPYPSYSLTEILSGKVPEEAIMDKIVIIGTTAVSMKDFVYTPFRKDTEIDNKMYGVELHGRIASQLIRSAREGSKPVRYISEWNEWFWIIFWGLAGGLLGLLGRSLWRFVLLVIISVSVLLLITYMTFISGWWIPVVPPAIAWLGSDAIITAYNSYRERKDRAFLMHLFSRHVSHDVANAIWQQREQFMDGNRPRSQKIVATVLFTDLKGFTSISEDMEPQTLMDWLNEYMDAMAQIVIEHGGVINKYIGDAIMAIFGVPIARTSEEEISTDAKNAVNCALAMSDRLEVLNRNWKERNLPSAKMRVGIYTGELIAGSLGSAQRMEYTVIGDTVNTASRLESFDKDSTLVGPEGETMLCRIIIGDGTYKYLGDNFITRKVGEAALKGKDEKITVYLVTGVAGQTPVKQ